MPIIKVENGAGFIVVNGDRYPKGDYDITKRGNNKIRMGTSREAIFDGDYTEFRDANDQSFASADALLDYLDFVFK